MRNENCFSSLGRPQGGHAVLTRSAFPVSLLYRTLDKPNDAFNFLLTSGLACVPIDHYCFSDVYQSIVNLLLYHSATKMRICCSQLYCIESNVPGPYFQYKLATKKKHERLYRVDDRTTPFRRHAVHRTGYSSDDLWGVDGQINAYPPVVYISDLVRVSSRVFQLVGNMIT